MYGNDVAIANALKELLPKYNLSRGDVIITTKLYPSDHADKAYEVIETFLTNLQCEYIDLYLIY